MSNIEEMRKSIKPLNDSEPYVFVSYSKIDAEIVYPMVIDLQKNGVNLWIDKELESSVGYAWQEKAFDAIRDGNCCKVLFFMSQNSFFSIPVCAELIYTLHTKVRREHGGKVEIVPISIDGAGNIGKVTEACENNPKSKVKIEKEGYDKFKDCLDKNAIDEIDAKYSHGGLIRFVFEKVFDNNKEITVASNVDSIMKNIPREVILTANDINNETIKADTDTKVNATTNDEAKAESKKDDSNKTHYEIVKKCVLGQIEKYKSEEKIVPVGNSKSIFTTKTINDVFKCNEFGNHSTDVGHLIGYYIGFYGLTKNSWNTFTFNIGVKDLDNKGIVKEKILALLSARNKLKEEGLLDKLIKDAEEKNIKVTVSYDDSIGKTSKNLATIRYNDDSDDEKVLIQNIDNCISWIESFEKELFQRF